VRRGGLPPFLVAVGLLATATPTLAQAWAADLYAGGTQQTALAGRTADINLIGSLRYIGLADGFAYVAGATPLNSDAVEWAAAGLGRRPGISVVAGGRVGLDLSAHTYAYSAQSEVAGGQGGTLHVLPYVAWNHGTANVELRAGRHEHRLRHDGAVHSRGLYEVGVRGGASRGGYGAEFTGRWLADDTTTFPFAGLQVDAAVGAARVWGGAGRWLVEGDGSTEWFGGVALNTGGAGQVWAGIRADGRDPLYQNLERTSWNIGVTRSFGARPAVMTIPAPRLTAGGVVFRLPRSVVANAPADGPPAVAGEFSGWQPLHMRLADGEWTLALSLPSGVHRFSFVSPGGEWFVPEGYPGRMDDGMGGWIAILVVP
jgi:hypothetical protein